MLFVCSFDSRKSVSKKSPSELLLDNVDASFIVNFLEHLRKARAIAHAAEIADWPRIHSFFRSFALEEPAHSAHIQRVLAIPAKRFDRKPINFLTRPEIEALLASPNQRTHLGRRGPRTHFVGCGTGLRVSEWLGLRCRDIVLWLRCTCELLGQRAERASYSSCKTASRPHAWLKERGVALGRTLFTNAVEAR